MRMRRNGKYSCTERARRFLVRQLPEEFQDGRDYRRITDHYIPDSRLRLRRVEASNGDHVVFKLTQKFADASSLTGRTTILTTFYVNESEYQRLAVLGGHEVTKRRYIYVYEGYHWALDVFTG